MSEVQDQVSRNYRLRKRALERLQTRLRQERKNWHSVWVRDQVPSRAVRDLIDELCELAEVGE